ncbi:aminoglycoside phosphotransferase [Novosphingobium endophyticum]|uniref:Aminoglycoside phosphotransferase n=1 Tax=Novosphingobium endophyticum TaxID=1955250 RepID=A0A916TTE6_9SPHN|nr:phosphotransferase family protein [Novosphingobium endophyticum]GGC00785.1 aminoglycoside phosphotransferase [Novosphingobium endophyticum]
MTDTATGLTEIDFDPARLQAWLVETMGIGANGVTIERVGGGQSNPTYFVTAGARRMVLRKRPGGTLAPGAHDVGREFRILRALYGTDVPLPEPIAYRDDDAVVGTAFYMMGRLDGEVFHDATLPNIPLDQRRGYYRELAKVLAAIHAVDWQSTELVSMARPGSFLARQVSRWGRGWTLAQDKVAAVVAWLEDALPADDTLSIVHGDYKLTNVIYRAEEPKIAGVFDWELCTIGDPLSDLAHIWSFVWDTAPNEYGGLRGLDLTALGLPTFEEFVADYDAAATHGRRLTRFHLVFAHLRTAGIFHGIRQRAAAGNAAAANADEKGELDLVYLQRALDLVHAAE